MPPALADLALELQREAAELGRGLHPDSGRELAEPMWMMSACYSSLIEGHNTRPSDIEAALERAELEPEPRPLALEATAAR